MASVRLGRYEIEEYDLPPVCAKCGQRAAVTRPKAFSWNPGWVLVFILFGLLPYVLVSLITTKRMTVALPLCQRHRNYWRNRAIFLYGGLLVLSLIGVGGLVLAAALGDDAARSPYVPVCFGTGFLFIIWLFAAAIMQVTSIRPGEITDNSITLVGLSRDFVRAVNEDRRGSEPDEEEYDDRPRRRRPRDEDDERRVRPKRALIDDDDERPDSRRRPAEDDDGGYYDPDARRPRRADDEDDR